MIGKKQGDQGGGRNVRALEWGWVGGGHYLKMEQLTFIPLDCSLHKWNIRCYLHMVSLWQWRRPRTKRMVWRVKMVGYW